MHAVFFLGKSLQERCRSSHKGLAYVGESWRMTRSQNVHKALECKVIIKAYPSIDACAFCIFSFFFNLSGALYEHKHVVCLSVRFENTESWVLHVTKSVNMQVK